MDDDVSKQELLAALPALAAPAQAGALRAFSQLLGGFGAYATAWMRRPRQAVDDKTDAVSLITKRIAEAAADRAAADPMIVDAALQRWLPSEIRKQSNKHNVAKFALEELSETNPAETSPDAVADQVDQDWLNSFERFVEDASSEGMQRLWAKVLSGEIVKPGCFSRSTLRFLHELDRGTAESFEYVAQHVVGTSILGHDDDQVLFSHLLHLEASGAVSGVGGLLELQRKASSTGLFTIPGAAYGLVGLTDPEAQVSLSSVPLTRSGKELLRIVPNLDEQATLRRVAETLKKPSGFSQTQVKGVALCRLMTFKKDHKLQLIENLWGEAPFDAIAKSDAA